MYPPPALGMTWMMTSSSMNIVIPARVFKDAVIGLGPCRAFCRGHGVTCRLRLRRPMWYRQIAHSVPGGIIVPSSCVKASAKKTKKGYQLGGFKGRRGPLRLNSDQASSKRAHEGKVHPLTQLTPSYDLGTICKKLTITFSCQRVSKKTEERPGVWLEKVSRKVGEASQGVLQKKPRTS